MSFVSVEYLILLATTFVLIHGTRSPKFHNIVILVAGIIFYGWWNWRYLPLIGSVSLINYWTALRIQAANSDSRRRAWLWLAVVVTFSILAYFKYANFFIDSFSAIFGEFGYARPLPILHILLPLGISFHTFQAIAYTIDVYRRDHAAERNLTKFLAFSCFFPQLVAGPIERARNLLDQFNNEREVSFERMQRAIFYLVYGYTVKMVLADGLAPIVDSMFVADQYSGWSVVLATIAFGLQIYCDFYGYSLIAIGSASLLGFDLSHNFFLPYWSTSIIDFWHRWHITLSTWLRDYLYIPLGGNRSGRINTYRNLLITMALGGLWHGAAWNFVAWGLLHGCALAAWRAFSIPLKPRTVPGRVAGWLVTMIIVFSGWFLFRASDQKVLSAMVAALTNWEWLPVHRYLIITIATVVTILAAMEFLQQRRQDIAAAVYLREEARTLILAVMMVLCLAMTREQHASFIYFQF